MDLIYWILGRMFIGIQFFKEWWEQFDDWIDGKKIFPRDTWMEEK